MVLLLCQHSTVHIIFWLSKKKYTSNTTRRLNGKTYVNCKGSISVPIIFLLKHKHKYPIQSSEKLNSHATCMFFTSYILLFVHIFIFHFFFSTSGKLGRTLCNKVLKHEICCLCLVNGDRWSAVSDHTY